MPGISRLFRWLPLIAGTAVAGLGLAMLAVWALRDSPLPERGAAAGPPRPEDAAAFAIAGTALLLLAGSPGPPRRLAGRALGILTAAIGLLGIIDRLGAEPGGWLSVRLPLGLSAADAPGFPAAAATALLLAGLSLATIDVPARPWWAWSQAFALGAAAIALVTLLAYIIEAGWSSPEPATMVAMPPISAAAILVLACGVILARPGEGLLRPLRSPGPGGILARRLAPTLALVPIGIALVTAAVTWMGQGPPELALALSTAVFLIIVVLMLSFTAGVIDQTAARRDRLLMDLADEQDFTATLLHSLSEAVVVFDRDLQVIDVNPRACELLGQQRERLLGQRPPYSWQHGSGPAQPPQNDTEQGGMAQAQRAGTARQGDVARRDGAGAYLAGDPDRLICRPDGTLVPVLARIT